MKYTYNLALLFAYEAWLVQFPSAKDYVQLQEGLVELRFADGVISFFPKVNKPPSGQICGFYRFLKQIQGSGEFLVSTILPSTFAIEESGG